MSPVQILRAAEQRLRDLAEGAESHTGDTWQYEHRGFNQVHGDAGPLGECAVCAYAPHNEGHSGPFGIVEFPEEVATFMGAMSPKVAVAIADWLAVPALKGGDMPHALAVARAVLVGTR